MRFLQNFSPKGLYWKVPVTEKAIYLTFDDSPTVSLTHEILSILGNYGAKATFFCVGEAAENLPGVMSDILSAGHATGNHTYHHLNGWKTGRARYLSDVSNCDAVIGSPLFRPPYGKMKLSQYRRLRKYYKIIMWDVLTRDYDSRVSKEDCLDRAIRLTRPGSIVVFHDNLKAAENMLYVLPRYLEHFMEKGYIFDFLDADNL